MDDENERMAYVPFEVLPVDTCHIAHAPAVLMDGLNLAPHHHSVAQLGPVHTEMTRVSPVIDITELGRPLEK